MPMWLPYPPAASGARPGGGYVAAGNGLRCISSWPAYAPPCRRRQGSRCLFMNQCVMPLTVHLFVMKPIVYLVVSLFVSLLGTMVLIFSLAIAWRPVILVTSLMVFAIVSLVRIVLSILAAFIVGPFVKLFGVPPFVHLFGMKPFMYLVVGMVESFFESTFTKRLFEMTSFLYLVVYLVLRSVVRKPFVHLFAIQGLFRYLSTIWVMVPRVLLGVCSQGIRGWSLVSFAVNMLSFGRIQLVIYVVGFLFMMRLFVNLFGMLPFVNLFVMTSFSYLVV